MTEKPRNEIEIGKGGWRATLNVVVRIGLFEEVIFKGRQFWKAMRKSIIYTVDFKRLHNLLLLPSDTESVSHCLNMDWPCNLLSSNKCFFHSGTLPAATWKSLLEKHQQTALTTRCDLAPHPHTSCQLTTAPWVSQVRPDQISDSEHPEWTE